MFSRILRRLTVAAMLTNALTFGYSEGVGERVNDVTRELLSFNGFNFVVLTPDWFFYFYYAVQFAVLLALLTLRRWAEMLFLVNVAAFTSLWLLVGIAISMPIEVFPGTLTTLLYGAIVLLVFLRASGRPAEE